MDFTVTVDHGVKIKKNEKIDKYFDLSIELKKKWNMKVAVILIVVGALGTVPKDLSRKKTELEELEIRGRIVAIHTTMLLRSARIQRRVLET